MGTKVTPSGYERLVFFPSGKASLAGILGVPMQPNGRTVLIPWGAGAFPSSARNRVRTRLARHLNDQGFHSFRFDYPGVGESDGEYRRGSVRFPYVDEVTDAYLWLQTQGLDRVSIVANCLGAWSSLIAAPRIPTLEALALLNPPVSQDHGQIMARQKPWGWWIKGLKRLRLSNFRSANRRASYRKLITAKAASMVGREPSDLGFRKSVEHAFDRNIPILLMYGPDGFRRDFDTALGNGLQSTLDTNKHLSRLVITEDRFEGLASLSVQDLVVREVSSWLLELGDVVGVPNEQRP